MNSWIIMIIMPENHFSEYTRRNRILIHVKIIVMRLSSLFSDCFSTERIYVWFRINQKMVNTIWLQLIKQRNLRQFLCVYKGLDRLHLMFVQRKFRDVYESCKSCWWPAIIVSAAIINLPQLGKWSVHVYHKIMKNPF